MMQYNFRSFPVIFVRHVTVMVRRSRRLFYKLPQLQTFLSTDYLPVLVFLITDIVIVRLNFLFGKQAKHDISIALLNDDEKCEFNDFTWLLELFRPLLPFDGCQTPKDG